MIKTLFLLLFSTVMFAQTPTTPNIQLLVPVHGSYPNQGDVPINYNSLRLDQYLSGGLKVPTLWAGTINYDILAGSGTGAAFGSNNASNTDLVGELILSSGTATLNFTGTYVTPPICITKDMTTPANATNDSDINTTRMIVTGTGTDHVKYICIYRN